MAESLIGIIGQGYVGLPLAVAFASRGHRVVGVDVDPAKVKALRAGRSYVSDVPSDVLAPLVRSGTLTASTDFRALKGADAVIICVPTPLRKTKDPDLSFIVSAAEKITPFLRRGQLVVLESTTYPGTTRELVLPILERSGLVAGRDFHLAFSPERVDPGNTRHQIRNTPKVVGGLTSECTASAARLYGDVVERVVRVSSPEAAEMVKLLENTFRAVNIALVNEVALMCDKLTLNAWEVIEAAATKPFGFMPFYPGPGIGGHCIPLDPHYLAWKLKTLNFSSRFIDLAGEINSHMPEYVLDRLARALNERGRAVKRSRILVIGAAYKKDNSDVRESPAIDVLRLLKGRGARVSYHDPYVARLDLGGSVLRSVPLTRRVLAAQEAAIIVTDHSSLDRRLIVSASRLVLDTRNATRDVRRRANVVLL